MEPERGGLRVARGGEGYLLDYLMLPKRTVEKPSGYFPNSLSTHYGE